MASSMDLQFNIYPEALLSTVFGEAPSSTPLHAALLISEKESDATRGHFALGGRASTGSEYPWLPTFDSNHPGEIDTKL